MTVVTWILHNLIEPMVWNTLQWVWSIDSSDKAGGLLFRFYSSSPTSLLLWLFEKLPHSLLLLMIVIGGCSLICLVVIGTCYRCCTSLRILSVLVRVGLRGVWWALRQTILVSTKLGVVVRYLMTRAC